jgi:hypothetical protein
MRQLIALCFIALIGTSMAVEIVEKSEMKVTTVPRGILAQIAARISADGPLDDVFGLFETLTNTIRGEQAKHDSLAQRQQVECKSEREFRNKEIGQAAAALSRASAEKTACSQSLDQAKIELRTNRKTQQDVGTIVRGITETRQSENAAFKRNAGAYKQAIEAVTEGRNILRAAYQGSASLLEVSKASAKMFTAGVEVGKAHHFGPVISALAQVAAKADLLIDANVLQRVEDLFRILLERLVRGQGRDQKVEAAAVSRFEQFNGKLQKQLKSLKKREGAIVSNISTLERCVLKAENIITLATTKKERNTSLFQVADKMCKNFEAEYKTASAARKEELTLIDKMRTVVSKKLKFTKGVEGRGRQNQDQFAKYQNKAQIAGPATWTKKGGVRNLKGEALQGKTFKFDADLARI